jgi:acetate kinase
MNGLDTIVFTGGIGENSPKTREEICKGFGYLGLELDDKKNKELLSKEAIITKDSSKINVIVIPTNEELKIAEDTERIIKGK